MSFWDELFRWLGRLFDGGDPPPPAPRYRAVAVVVSGPDGPVNHASVVLGTVGGPWYTNADGYVCWPRVLADIVESHLNIEAEGYLWYSEPVELGRESIELHVTLTRGPPEPEPEPEPEPPAPTIPGQLRIADGIFRDDAGPVLPVHCHFGEALSAWMRRPDQVRAQLEVIAGAGYDGIRTWLQLATGPGDTYWQGREVGERYQAGYWNRLRYFLLALRGVGLRAELSLNLGDLSFMSSRRAYVEHLGSLLNELGPEVAAVVEMANEGWQTGLGDPGDLAQCAAWFHARCPQPLLVLTSPPGETKAELDAYAIAPASMWAVHGYRDGHWWDKVRHIFSIPYEQQPRLPLGWQSEPTGPGDAVSVTEHKEELTSGVLAAMATMALATGQGWTYMSGFGVRWDGPLESQPGFYEVPRVREVLPVDIMSWPTLIHGGSRWGLERIFAARDEVRADHALAADGRFACMIYGPGDVGYGPEKTCAIERDVRLGPARLVVGRR